MFFKKINLLILLSIITGCSVTNKELMGNKTIAKENYGIWQKKSCKLYAKKADITISLTDLYKGKRVRLLAQSDYDLVKKPEFKIYGLEGYDFEITGAGSTYSFEIPTALVDQARMHLNQAFIEIKYQKINTDYYKKAIFSLQSLPKAMLDIKKSC